MKKTALIVGVLILAGIAWYAYRAPQEPLATLTEERGGVPYEMITVDSPRPDSVVTSPLTVTGRARGYWFFEASFPVSLVNWDGLIIAQGIATAKDDWMTEELVEFEAVLAFEKPTLYPERGALILQRDNPSGLPENDAALEIPIRYE
ncbi:MAG: hypothetical protein AMXMBFR44_4700 [Candidatus Campbellbacteria bacterium]